jgi:hypothetical protein
MPQWTVRRQLYLYLYLYLTMTEDVLTVGTELQPLQQLAVLFSNWSYVTSALLSHVKRGRSVRWTD